MIQFSRLVLLSAVAFGACALHAADNPDAPWQPKMGAASDEAENMIKGFKVPKDLKVELFAAEPLLAHPVALCCDERGRFYVAETWRFADGINGGGDRDFGALDLRGHMDWLDQDLASKSPADREAMLRRGFGDKISFLTRQSEIVRMVWDSTGSGKADKATIFADGFNGILDGVGAGVLARKGNVYFTCIPNLWLLRDTKGEDKADVKKILQTGFGCRIAFLGHDLHGLVIGPDGKLYFSVGDRGYNVTIGGKNYVGPERGAVFRCNQDGSEFEIFATGLRNPQKLAFDAYGNLFTADNNADHGDSARWVYIVEGGETGWRGGYQYITQPNVLGMWHSEKIWNEQHEGQPAYALPPIKDVGQGPSGIAYYPGTGLPERYDNHFFYCDYKGNGGIFSFSMKPKGAGFEYVDDKDREFFWKNQATDLCFGVDGGAYACVWVGGITKTGRGRIYRICDPNLKTDALVLETKKLINEGMEKRAPDELAQLLEQKDIRVRQEAQFELAARGEVSLPTLTRALQSKNQFARLHAIWGMGQIAHDKAFTGMSAEERDKNLAKPWAEAPLEPLLAALSDTDAEVVAQAAKILGDARWPKAADRLATLLKHENLRVRFFAAYGLGKLGNSDAIESLSAMLRDNADKDVFLRHAGVMALTWIAENYPDLVLAKSNDASVSVRMAVCLVLRRLEDPRIAQFLADKNPLVVIEAARAINDVPINGAMPELAKLAAPAEPTKRKPEDSPTGFEFKVEYWDNLKARTYAEFIKHIAENPKPDKEETLTGMFETPSDRADYYGSRVTGLITAPQTGNYTFWIAVDDWAELFLSTDETPANKKRIAETHAPQWNKPREWYKYPNQKSAPVKLEAGKKYYIETLMFEGRVSDNLAVGWQLPSGVKQMPIGNTEIEEEPRNIGLTRRALNANFRVGSAENAKILADYAARKEAPVGLRTEALSMLADWPSPPPRDKIMNLHRPLPPRDSAIAAAALKPHIDTMFKSAGRDMPIAASNAAARLKMSETLPALEALYQDTKRDGDTRAAALNALVDLKSERAHEFVRNAAASRDANLKKAGNAQLAKINPKDAVVSLKKVLENEKATVADKQNAFSVIGGIKIAESDALLSDYLNKLIAGNVPAELQLDVLEAAGKSDAKPMKDLLAKFNDALPKDEHRTIQVAKFRETMIGGEVEAGKKIFHEHTAAQCIRCHKIAKDDKLGGDVGPPLAGIGTREKRDYLLESIIDPSAKIAKGFETVMVKTNEGVVYTGILKAEDDKQLTVLPGDGKPVMLDKADIKLRRNQEESTMPPMGGVLTKFEIRNLIEYLSSLK